MEWVKVYPGRLEGLIRPPPSKSQTLRAVLLASFCNGASQIENALDSPDTDAMIGACRRLGAKITREGRTISVEGLNRGDRKGQVKINAGNSGIVLRFGAAAASLLPFETTLYGDASLSRRPMAPLLKALQQRGASTSEDPLPPVTVRGMFQPGKAHILGRDSQFVSALLIAAAFTEGRSEIVVEEPGELPWAALTLDWLKRLGIKVNHENYRHYVIEGREKPPPFDYTVPADFSSAAFPVAAALTTGSELEVAPLDFTDPQGDKELFSVLQKMGGVFEQRGRSLTVKPAGSLRGMTVDVNRMIDALPILAVIGCFAKGETRLVNGEVARTKECDRIECMAKELKKMGADIQTRRDGLIIRPSALKGAKVDSHGDHRVAMALAVAAFSAAGQTGIDGFECTAKTFPGFVSSFQAAGANIETPRAKSLILIGLPKAGKSTLSRQMAEKTDWKWIDTDNKIEELYEKNSGEKKTCKEIFREHGEHAFRSLEKFVIDTLQPEANTLISAGGGAVMDPQNLSRLKALGPLVLVDTPEETVVRRNQADPPAYVDAKHPIPSILKMIRERGQTFRSHADHTLRGADAEGLKHLMEEHGKQ